MPLAPNKRELLRRGTVIPAHPLALTADGRLDQAGQRALTRYYLEAGAGGLAVGVHTTQFEIREAGLLREVLAIAAETVVAEGYATVLLVAGARGATAQAVAEAELAIELGYDAVLLSLAGWHDAPEPEVLDGVRNVAEVAPVMGFSMQTAIGGRSFGGGFWRELVSIEQVVGVKIAPFDRYVTCRIMRAVVDVGRAGDVALYTGNDDHIIEDLIVPGVFGTDAGARCRFVGGLLGHWAVWTRPVVEYFERIRRVRDDLSAVPADVWALSYQVTDMNDALFDAANVFRGCIAGVNHVLAEQGLIASGRCLSDREALSPGQREEIDRVRAAYPWLVDDDWVAENVDRWRR